MTRYLLISHDGFGLGHARRNCRIADALTEGDPDATVILVSGLAVDVPWNLPDRTYIYGLAPLVKNEAGQYRNNALSFEDALVVRADRFDALVADVRPNVVLVDRHPYGIGGEFTAGLHRARTQGAVLFVGLRDVLDEPTTVRAELAGGGWDGVESLFEGALIYGNEILVDHQREYGLQLPATYCGWVTRSRQSPLREPEPNHLLVTTGGGGDGEALISFTTQVLDAEPNWRATIIAGPYRKVSHAVHARARYVSSTNGYDDHLAGAAAVMQMAGYNSTAESIAFGVKPILAPRRNPRREQAIRASRLTALGLADVLDQGAAAGELGWMLNRPRRLQPDAARAVGLELDGARVAAQTLGHAARKPMLIGAR